jgi:hypothetical protein
MYQKWLRAGEARFVSMTGYTTHVFKDFLPYFEAAHNDYFSKYDIAGKKKKQYRQFIIYNNSPLPTIEDRLCFILSFNKLNPIQEQHSDWFNMTQKQCNQFIHSLNTVLNMALENASVVPATDEKILLEKLDTHEEITILHDGTEREIPRPIDYEAQKENYSGKKKKHTLKNAVIASTLCMILFVGNTVSGATHDKKIAETQYSNALSKTKATLTLLQDAGYQGLVLKGVSIIQPKKKPKGRELTNDEKETNKAISKVRVMIEHVIGSVKRYRIVKDECRLRKNKYPYKVFLTCAALHNFRIEKMPVKYPEIKLT